MNQISVSGLLLEHNNDPAKIISILNVVQRQYGYLPREILSEIANVLKISLAKIFGIVTFYAEFSLEKPGKYKIKSCQGTACFVKQAKIISNSLKFSFDIESGKTTQDGLFSLEEVACLGACALAPVLDVNGDIHGMMNVNKTKKLIKRFQREENKS